MILSHLKMIQYNRKSISNNISTFQLTVIHDKWLFDLEHICLAFDHPALVSTRGLGRNLVLQQGRSRGSCLRQGRSQGSG